MAVGAVGNDDVASTAGGIWILFMNADGTVSSSTEIASGIGGFVGPLIGGDKFGSGIAALGDLDGDGIEDIAVGAPGDETGGSNGGAVYILNLNTAGAVIGETKIAHGLAGFSGDLATPTTPEFGVDVAPIGDLDGDSNMDIVVSAYHDDDGGTNRGAVYILFLDTDGTVLSDQKISATTGGLTATLVNNDEFGSGIDGVGDLDGDGNEDIVVGARSDDDGGSAKGAFYTLFLDTDGTVLSEQKVSSTAGAFAGSLANFDYFGHAVAAVNDIDGDGVVDYAVGAYRDDNGGLDRGATWILFMDTDGTVNGFQKISSTQGGLVGPLDNSDNFGFGVTGMGDLNGDGYQDIAVGSRFDDDFAGGTGAAYILFLDGCNLESSFTVSDMTPCQDATVTFTNTATNTGTFTYDWQEDFVSVATTTDHSQSFPAGGDYDMSLITSKTNCPNDTTTVTISVIPEATSAFSVTECVNYTVPSGDETYSTSVVVTDTIPSAAGCDSVMTITITIAPEDPAFSYTSPTFCDTDTDPLPTVTGTPLGTFSATPAGLTINSSSGLLDLGASTTGITYTIKYVTPGGPGCADSATFAVTIGAATASAFDVAACDTYTVPSTDETYTISGVYNDTIPNAEGCDSVMTITVTIGLETTSAFADSDCESYTVPSGDETYVADGVYNDTIPNAAGCDSVMTITVTILNNTTSVPVVVACNSYTVPSGDETYTSGGIVNDTIPNAAGCDSIMSIALTINTIDTSVTATDTSLMSNETGTVTYQWYDCTTMMIIAGETNALFVPTANGSYAVIVDDGSCSDTSACHDITQLSLDELGLDFTVYPNPTDGQLTVRFNQAIDRFTIRCLDMTGRMVYMNTVSNETAYSFELEGEDGIYLLELTDENGNRSVRQIVKH